MSRFRSIDRATPYLLPLLVREWPPESHLARNVVDVIERDATRIHANASRHGALSHVHAERMEAQLKAEVQELLALAEAPDQSVLPEDVSLPDEIQRREDRLAAIARAKAPIEVRASARDAHEQAWYPATLAHREAQQEAPGKKPGDRPPAAPPGGPRAEDQVNLTDEDSRTLRVATGGFGQCCNAQAAVDVESLLIVGPDVTQACNDNEQIAPALAALPEGLNQSQCLLADTGCLSAKNVEACEAAGINLLIAVARDAHYPHWRERFEEPATSAMPVSPVEGMRHLLKTRQGRANYALRKQTVEPVFGIIKSAMGSRQFLLRGPTDLRTEWTLVCFAWSLKRMAVLRPKSVQMA